MGHCAAMKPPKGSDYGRMPVAKPDDPMFKYFR